MQGQGQRKGQIMPTYEYQCECGHSGEYINRFDEYQVCPDCSKTMKRVPVRCLFSAKTGYMGYYNETLGTFITSETHQKQVMREQNATLRGDTPKPDGQAWV
jgi:putative FmdB family regulatory protein